MGNFTRREILGVAASAGALIAAGAPATIESHVHLFDPDRVPYAPNAPYKPAAYTLEDHLKLVGATGLAHSIIVHPEPYQDDHRYLEYCFAHEPSLRRTAPSITNANASVESVPASVRI